MDAYRSAGSSPPWRETWCETIHLICMVLLAIVPSIIWPLWMLGAFEPPHPKAPPAWAYPQWDPPRCHHNH